MGARAWCPYHIVSLAPTRGSLSVKFSEIVSVLIGVWCFRPRRDHDEVRTSHFRKKILGSRDAFNEDLYLQPCVSTSAQN